MKNYFERWGILPIFVNEMRITDHIQHLLRTHDCVVVPGIGAFVAQYVAAHLSDDCRRLLPPGRQLVFNNIVVHDDGVLAESVSRAEGISYEAARIEINRQTEEMRRRLESEGSIDIARIGRLTLHEQGALSFLPDTENPIVKSPFLGLAAVDLPEEETDIRPVVLEVAPRRKPRLRPALRYAAAVAILAGLGITFSTPIMIGDRKMDHASLNLPKISGANAAVVPVVEGAVEKQETMDAPVAKAPCAATAPVSTRSALPPIVAVEDMKSISGEPGYDCYIIVASCANRAEAKRFIAMRKAEGQLDILPSDGRYRVYAAVARDYDEAFAFKTSDRDFRSKYGDAWVYQKK